MTDSNHQPSPFVRFAEAIVQIISRDPPIPCRAHEVELLRQALKTLETDGTDAFLILPDNIAGQEQILRRSVREFGELHRPRPAHFDNPEESEGALDNPIFRVRQLKYTYPNNRLRTYNCIRTVRNWTVAAVINERGESHLVTQARPFTTRHMSIETAGGFIDRGEAPEEAAVREVLEETGQVTQELVSLGSVRENHATLDAEIPLFLALVDSKNARELPLDETEKLDDLQRHVVSPLTMAALLIGGFFPSSCQNVAFERALRYLKREKPELLPSYIWNI